jgi:hypothetical protein
MVYSTVISTLPFVVNPDPRILRVFTGKRGPRSFPTRLNLIYLWMRFYYSLLLVRIRIFLSSSKNSKKTLMSIVLRLFYDFLFLKTDVNVPSKFKKQKKLLLN